MDADAELTLAVERFDLEAYVQQQAGERVSSSGEYLLTCPVCFKDGLSVNVRKRRWHCFRCEKVVVDALGNRRTVAGGGGVLKLVKWMEQVSTRDAVQKLLAWSRALEGSPTSLPEMRFAPRASEYHVPLEQLLPTGLPEGCLPVTADMPYLQRRGITLDDARAFGLGWCPTGWVGNRLVFPVWERGAAVYWQARAMWDEREHRGGDKYLKTLNPARERHGRLYLGSGDVVLNLEQAVTYPRVCITEGPTSAIRVGPSAVATFGKHLKPNQIAKLISAGVSAVDFMWDGPSPKEPEGAWPEMIAAAYQLAPFMDVRLVFLPHGDPGDWPRAQLAVFRAQARPLDVATSRIEEW